MGEIEEEGRVNQDGCLGRKNIMDKEKLGERRDKPSEHQPTEMARMYRLLRGFHAAPSH